MNKLDYCVFFSLFMLLLLGIFTHAEHLPYVLIVTLADAIYLLYKVEHLPKKSK